MATTAALTAFRESYFDADTLAMGDDGDWGAFEARRLRYDVLWAYYQGNAYRAIHRWAKKHKADYGLYKYVRDLYNPAFELGSFYETYIWGGPLDMLAGDGRAVPSALPIITQNEKLRPAIATVWRWSNWLTKRKLVNLYGAVLGDVFIQVVDDPHRGKVYLKIVHPGIVQDVSLDPFGNVKGYTFEYPRLDAQGKSATYRETAERDGDETVITQYRNGQPHDWEPPEGGSPEPERRAPYGFVPLVFIPHRDVGLTWGMAEAFPRLSLFREVDDQVSKVDDQIRKLVDAPWLFSGVKKAETSPSVAGAAASAETRPEPGREEIPALYATDPQAKATPLVAPLDIGQVTAHIQAMLEKMEHVYPELALHRVRAMNNPSGRAVRLLRGEAEGKAVAYRDVYDGALARAQQMAVAIGGWRGYPQFAGFGLESYAAGDLEHQIGARPVFAQDPLDEAETELARLTNLKQAVDAGWSLAAYMRYRGYDEDTIAKLEAAPEYQARLAALAQLIGGGLDG